MGNGNRQASIEKQFCDILSNDVIGSNSNLINNMEQYIESNKEELEVECNDRKINSQDGIHHQQQQQSATAVSLRVPIHMFEQQFSIPSSTWNDVHIVHNTNNSDQSVQCSKQNNQTINPRINSNIINSTMQTPSLTLSQVPLSTNTTNLASSYYQPSASTSLTSMFDMMLDKKVKTTGPIHNAKYKIKLCDKYMIDGKCPYKEKCQFAHGHEELMMWAERRRAYMIQQSSPFTFSSSPVQQQVVPAIQNNASLNNMYNGVPSAHIHHTHPYQVAINSDANYHFSQNEMRKTAPYHSYGDQEEKTINNMYISSSNNIVGASSNQHGQVSLTNESLSSTASFENDPLIKSIVDLLDSGDLGCEDNVLDCTSRERLLSADIANEVSFMSPTLRPSTTNAATRSPFGNPQSSAQEVLSPSKDFSMNDKSESFRSPFRSQNHNMRVNFAAFQRGSM